MDIKKIKINGQTGPSMVDKRHPYEMDEKLHRRVLDEKETNGKNCIHTQ
jgi:hypothetical protein